MHSRSSSFLVKDEEDTDKKKTCMIMIRKYDGSCLKIELRVMINEDSIINEGIRGHGGRERVEKLVSTGYFE